MYNVSAQGVDERDKYTLLLFIAFIYRYYLLSSRHTAHISHVILNEWLCPFITRIINIHGSGYWQHCLVVAWLVPRKTASVSELCTSLQCHFIQSHIGRMYVSLAVTCHLHFWRNDRDLLRATAVTRGWNGYRDKSQHRKMSLEKKILLPLLPGLVPGTVRSRVRCSNHWAIPALLDLLEERVVERGSCSCCVRLC